MTLCAMLNTRYEKAAAAAANVVAAHDDVLARNQVSDAYLQRGHSLRTNSQLSSATRT
jgi:hypothetical protein